MYSSYSGVFQPSIANQSHSLLYNNNFLVPNESDYKSSSGSMYKPRLRFIIIRHGERVDAMYGAGWTRYAFNYAGQYYPFDGNMPPTLPFRYNWLDYELDTPLTLRGLQQSWNVGNVLSQKSEPVVACYSSPAFRSIQTADQILSGMGRRYLPIRLELGLFECSSWYAQLPLNFLSDQELIDGGFYIDTKYRSLVNNIPAFENMYQYYERSKNTMQNIIKLHKSTSGTVLIVGHAPSLEVLTRHLVGGRPRPEQLGNLASQVDFCSMTVIEKDPTSKSWLFRSSLDDQIDWQQSSQRFSSSVSPQYNYYPSHHQNYW